MKTEELAMLDECLNAESGLTPGEITFVESMDDKRDVKLSWRQSECLYGIASKLP